MAEIKEFNNLVDLKAEMMVKAMPILKAYHRDLIIDFNELDSVGNGEDIKKTYYWFVRELGTHIFDNRAEYNRNYGYWEKDIKLDAKIVIDHKWVFNEYTTTYTIIYK